PVAEYRAQHRGGKGITGHKPKEEDFVERMFVCSSHDDLLLFSTLGKVYRIKAFEIPEAARTARGRAMVNLVQIAQDEKITTIIPVKEKEGFIAFATKNGMIKKTRLEEFERINRNGKIAIKLIDGDELISVQFKKCENELMIASRAGKCIRFSEANVRSMGRDTAGVRAMKLEGENDALVDMLVVDESKDLLTVTANGFGKRSRLEDYRVQGRAGKGIKAGTFNEVTGDLVNLKQVTEEDDVMLISEGGTIIRMHCDAISKFGRASRGVRLMRLKDGAVATVAITERDDEAETVAPEETAADVPDEPAETEEESSEE
ncbi:MAG: DNA gyrase subunit A, partial [Clostridia bacterium]|nr:DNA gyrase subunit A [Clostridia bacterium]